MRIIGIDKQVSTPVITLLRVILIFSITGCVHGRALRKAQDDARLSRQYYQQAKLRYQGLIEKGRDLERLYLELGKLYLENGDFESANDALRHSDGPAAKKLLAISLFKLANFTDALEVFNLYPIDDDEYLYYHASTCEKLNLFDEAMEIYRRIKNEDFARKAHLRAEIIEKQGRLSAIASINPQTARIISIAPAKDAYPQAGALILYSDEKVRIYRDRTEESSLHYIIKILNERGKERFSETHIDYDSTYEKVELEFARTVRPDGLVVDVGRRHIRDVSKYMNFPLYSNARVFIVSFPEIAQGSVIEYKVKVRRNQLVNKKDFILAYSLQALDPVIRAKFSVSLPGDMDLRTRVVNAEYNDFGAQLTPRIAPGAQGTTVYSWDFRDIPQIMPESNMPPLSEINPTILISTFSSWQEIYSWWFDLAKDRIVIDEAIKAKVGELVGSKSDDLERAAAIYNFCAQDIRYVAVEYGQAGHQPHYATDIFRNKYGDCKDQAVLLVAMLREAGLRAWPVLISTRDNYDLNAEFPALFFNHAICAVELKDKTIFLDPTASTCSFGDLPSGDQDRNVLIIKQDGFFLSRTPIFGAGHNLVRQKIKIRVDTEEKICAEKEISTKGIYDQAQRQWFLYTPPELIGDTLKEKIQEISIGAALKGYEIKNLDDLNRGLLLRYAFCGPQYFTRAGALRILPQLAEPETSVAAKDKRRYPLDLGLPDIRQIIFDIELPPAFVVKYVPKSVLWNSRWYMFSAQYRRLNQRIMFRQKMRLKQMRVTQEQYPDFKKFFLELAQQLKQRIVLEKKE